MSSLQALTWCTVAGAVVSALLLAAGESGLPDRSHPQRRDVVVRTVSPAHHGTAIAQQRKAPLTAPAGMINPVAKRELTAR
ncbi:hypothetical protein [Piscinibacter sp.]|uniref:hypothetical protein n=1 Tax=Piscinibacter sp. TaxID=1903157 RepID=UPI002CFFE13D|nr:hypothetical protein [Albitalea sp.]HUG26336.1 hypothetical protein [Albitalea sp.]